MCFQFFEPFETRLDLDSSLVSVTEKVLLSIGSVVVLNGPVFSLHKSNGLLSVLSPHMYMYVHTLFYPHIYIMTLRSNSDL